MAGVAISSKDVEAPQVGALLRAARRNQGLTLQEVGDRAELSVGYLSQIERDMATPSLGSLKRLAAALRMDINHFIRMPDASGMISRAADRETVWVRAEGMTYERLHGEFAGASFSAFLITLPSGFVTETDQHFGEEFVEVRSGQVTFSIDGTDYVLGPGDTLHFRSDMRHQARNADDGEAVLFWLGSGPTFRKRPDFSARVDQ